MSRRLSRLPLPRLGRVTEVSRVPIESGERVEPELSIRSNRTHLPRITSNIMSLPQTRRSNRMYLVPITDIRDEIDSPDKIKTFKINKLVLLFDIPVNVKHDFESEFENYEYYQQLKQKEMFLVGTVKSKTIINGKSDGYYKVNYSVNIENVFTRKGTNKENVIIINNLIELPPEYKKTYSNIYAYYDKYGDIVEKKSRIISYSLFYNKYIKKIKSGNIKRIKTQKKRNKKTKKKNRQ